MKALAPLVAVALIATPLAAFSGDNLSAPKAEAEPHSEVRVDISAGPGPQAVMADGRIRFAYELRLTNFRDQPVELTGLEVFGDDPAQPLARVSAANLDNMVGTVGPKDTAASPRKIAGGRTVEVFLDLTLSPGVSAPKSLRHRVSITSFANGEPPTQHEFDGPVLNVVPAPAMVLRAPLSGPGWIAANGLFNPAHRRAINMVDGKGRLAQRFAIDWVRLCPDGRAIHGARNVNASYCGWGAEVRAAADGEVTELFDGVPENAGPKPQDAVPTTPEMFGGNHLILKLPSGRYAVYAHLQPGSFKVKPGQHVRAGQVLALLGDSGHSDAPHLHFQLVDANSNLGAEGVPYVLDRFTQRGTVLDIDGLLADTAPPPAPAAPIVRRVEFPLDGVVVDLP